MSKYKSNGAFRPEVNVKYQKAVTTLSVIILVFSVAASLAGLLTEGGPGQSTYTSVGGELVTLYGEGLYQNDSVSVAAQAGLPTWSPS